MGLIVHLSCIVSPVFRIVGRVDDRRGEIDVIVVENALRCEMMANRNIFDLLIQVETEQN